ARWPRPPRRRGGGPQRRTTSSGGALGGGRSGPRRPLALRLTTFAGDLDGRAGLDAVQAGADHAFAGRDTGQDFDIAALDRAGFDLDPLGVHAVFAARDAIDEG